MKQAAKQIAACALLLIAVCAVCRLTVFRTYNAAIPIGMGEERSGSPGKIRAESGDPDVLRLGEPSMRSGYMTVPMQAGKEGRVNVRFFDQDGEEIGYQVYRVGRLGTVFDLQTDGFTGDTAVLIAVTLFWLIVSAIMLWHYFQAKGASFYAYSTIYFSGFSIFALVTGFVMLFVTARHIVNPASYSMLSAYGTINRAATRFMLLTMPLVLVFAVAMGISNVALLRHERPQLQNVLSLLFGFFLIAGEIVGVLLNTRDFSGSEWEGRVRNTLENVYATVFVYVECMLAGSVICGVKAAKHQPALDKDVIIILGCWFRRDGTLPPLLRGRVDRAIAFWRRQKEESGREAVLIPSGGQGMNETMPEAEAMRRYLISQDIPESVIRPEDQSLNTYQNMAYSKKIIDEIAPEGKVVYATTNYHVFRSGVWAARAGLRAEGIGGKTKWWYWPNAFMRECVGLMRYRWKQELALLAALIVFFGVLSMIL